MYQPIKFTHSFYPKNYGEENLFVLLMAISGKISRLTATSFLGSQKSKFINRPTVPKTFFTLLPQGTPPRKGWCHFELAEKSLTL
jgi:hypothetical protein